MPVANSGGVSAVDAPLASTRAVLRVSHERSEHGEEQQSRQPATTWSRHLRVPPSSFSVGVVSVLASWPEGQTTDFCNGGRRVLGVFRARAVLRQSRDLAMTVLSGDMSLDVAFDSIEEQEGELRNQRT